MNFQDLKSLYFSPLGDLVERARAVHKKRFNTKKIQASRLLSIKTGGCSENCAYCSQSVHWNTSVKSEKLLSLNEVKEKAREAKKEGASRFCMGAAWREIHSGPVFEQVLQMVKAVNDMGLEVCCTLGMLSLKQARQLKKAGLYAYNHNIDTSREYYPQIITSRKYEDRLKTLEKCEKGRSYCLYRWYFGNGGES